MDDRLILKNGLVVHEIVEGKFHEVLCNLKIQFKLEARTNTIANLLMRMMDDRTESEPTKTAMSRRSDLLYGAKTSSQTYTTGMYQVIDLNVKAISPRFTSENLTQHQLDLLADMYLTPLLTESTLQEAKRNFKLNMDRIKESNGHFAMLEAFKHSAPKQTFSLNTFGDLQDVDTITLEEVVAFHKRVVDEFGKFLFIVGETSALDLSRFEVGHSAAWQNPLLTTHVEDKMMTVEHEGHQTDLIFVYDTDITPNHPLYLAYLVYVCALGQLPSSLLFQNIREKESLAYTVYASRQMFDGVFYIATAINDKNLDKTIALVSEQFEIMKTAPLDIQGAVRYLQMSLEGSSENLKTIADRSYRNTLLNDFTSVEEIQEQLNTVTLAQVQAVSEHISKPFIYAYRGMNHEEN